MQHLSLIDTPSSSTSLRGGAHLDADANSDGTAFSEVMQEFDLAQNPRPEELLLAGSKDSTEFPETPLDADEMERAQEGGQQAQSIDPDFVSVPEAKIFVPTETEGAGAVTLVSTVATEGETIQTRLTATPLIATTLIATPLTATHHDPHQPAPTPRIGTIPSHIDGTDLEHGQPRPSRAQHPTQPEESHKTAIPRPMIAPRRISVPEATTTEVAERIPRTSPVTAMPIAPNQVTVLQAPLQRITDGMRPNPVITTGLDVNHQRRAVARGQANYQSVPTIPQAAITKPVAPTMPTPEVEPTFRGAMLPDGARPPLFPVTSLEAPIGQAVPTPATDNISPRLLGPNTAAVVQNIAQQMAVSVRAASDGTTELRLAPVELGRVEMRMATTETGVLVQLTFDRADTQDLVRRHIGDLTAEFRQMGFRDISFAFAGQGGRTADGQTPAPMEYSDDPHSEEPEPLPVAEQQTSLAQTDGLDLRL